MKSDDLGPATWTATPPILLVLVSFPIAGFCGALVTDITYAKTANIMWSDFSDWLLAAAILLGSIAALFWLVDVLAHRRARLRMLAWPAVIGGLLVLILGLLDNLVHSRDGWTSVVPTGLALSVATVIVMLITVGLASRSPRRVDRAGYEGGRS